MTQNLSQSQWKYLAPKEEILYCEDDEALKRLPREVVDALLLETLKAILDQPDLVEGVPTHGRNTGVFFKVPSNPNHSTQLYENMYEF